ncbi:MAG: dihydroxy-acid dehydratase, partial [Thermodesulfobacteriota bacterium]
VREPAGNRRGDRARQAGARLGLVAASSRDVADGGHLVGIGRDRDVALLTDGRFSGGSKGAAIGHISPEAAEGGPIAAVQEGDRIEIDIPGKKLSLLISDEELKARLGRWKPVQRELKGYLKRYAQLVRSAHTGATFE